MRQWCCDGKGDGVESSRKVGSNEIYEKDINLAIAKNLQSYFEQSGAVVIMTRSDEGATASNKNDDMRTRKEIINTSKADILISIHQNSFDDSSVRGAQVFYYNSEKSTLLANEVQNEINSEINTTKQKNPAVNDNYYILKETNIPSIIMK